MNKILAMMKQHERALALLAVIVLVLLGNGQLAITDPVESNYALTAKEMLRLRLAAHLRELLV